MVVVSLALLGTGFLALWGASLRVPDLSSFENRKIEQSTKIYDRTGAVLLYDLHGNAERTVISYDQIPRDIKNATVAIEDENFYLHGGIRFTSILRAILANITSLGFSQGGSTITQQVVKNSILTTEKTLSRKLKEWILAIKMERVLTKDEILGLYLNETPYGGNLYGIEAASEAYFGTSASALTLAESAYLAALPQAPTYYSPYGSHRDKLEERKNTVLKKMIDNGFIAKDEYEAALAERVAFKPAADQSLKAPHFVFYIREYLEQKYGQDAIENGLKIITTLDYDMQRKAEEIVKKYATDNEKNFNASNAAMVALDPKTGQILVMVGSRDYFDKEIDGNFNVALAHRQPGSAFKPFVYAEAFLKGYTQETVVFDLRTQFSTSCRPEDITLGNEEKPGCYSPVNYDNNFLGPITLRDALAQSRNIPAVKVFYLAGLKDSLQLAKNLGITTLGNINQYGLTLVLGGGEVTLLDMAGAYGVFPNDGARNTPTGILKVEDAGGKVLESYNPRPAEVLPPAIARTVTDILSDNVARTPEFGSNSVLNFPGHEVAVKTGTTNNYRDAWIIGYTPDIVVGAWAGNNDNSPMVKKIAGFIVAPMWNAFMQEAIAAYPNNSFKKPDRIDTENLKPIFKGLWQGGEGYTIDSISGKLATEFTPPELRIDKATGDVHSILYSVDKDNPLGPAPAHPESDPQFANWEYPITLWKAARGITDGLNIAKPTEYDDVHGPQFAPTITVLSPRLNETFDTESRVAVTLASQGRFPLLKVDFFVNGTPVGTVNRTPFSFSFVPGGVENINKENTLRIVAYDAVLNKSATEVAFTVR